MSGIGILGKVIQVKEGRAGTELARDHVLGETVLEVENVLELPPTGTIAAGLRTYAMTRDDVADQDVDELELEETPDPDLGTITVDPGLTIDLDDGSPVLVWPIVIRRTAYVFLEEQEEEIPARVDDSLYGAIDRLPTGTRDDPEDAETVVVVHEDDEWIVRDVVGEQGQSFGSAYVAGTGPVTVVSTDPLNPDVVASVWIDIPSDQKQLRVTYFATLDAPTAGDLSLGFDDAGVDFPVGEIVLAIQNDSTSSGPHDALPLLPAQAQDTGYVRAGAIAATAGLQALPTIFAPYTLDRPTPGLHLLRLTAWKTGAGAATVDNVRLDATVS